MHEVNQMPYILEASKFVHPLKMSATNTLGEHTGKHRVLTR